MDFCRRRHHDFSRFVLRVFVGLASCLFVGGCRPSNDVKSGAGDAVSRLVSSKAIQSYPADRPSERLVLKPGHWMSVAQRWQANEEDLRGTWEVLPRVVRGGDSAALPREGVPGQRTERPAILPRGQSKELVSRVLIPEIGAAGGSGLIELQTQLSGRTFGTAKSEVASKVTMMAPHEYFFVVLTTRPSHFSGYQLQDWATLPQAIAKGQEGIIYRVVFPPAEGFIPLPETLFEWTSTAFLLWDDIGPQQLTIEQRAAIRDWLHWGGKLIVNGEKGATQLESSEFARLLPLESIRVDAIDSERLQGLVEAYSVGGDRTGAQGLELFGEGGERLGVVGNLRDTSFEIEGTEGLLWERPCGRGSVLISGIDLGSSWLQKWGSYESFMNGVVLGNAARRYRAVQGELVLEREAGVKSELDSRLNTRFRLFARDAVLDLTLAATNEGNEGNEGKEGKELEEVRFWTGEGLGAWSNRSEVVRLALQRLREEAGITIPDARFVLRSLAVYLVILIPLNYLLFSFLGRLEWAWFSIPLMGLVGAVWIARSAQLDIGFARSISEIDVLEVQPQYDRAHVSRFVAIYNSLSTNYQVRFSDRDAVMSPLVAIRSMEGTGPIFREGSAGGVQLDSIAIPSNQTITLRAEQMLALGGTLELQELSEGLTAGEKELVNGSSFAFRDLVLVRRRSPAEYEYAELGVLAPQRSARLRWSAAAPRFREPMPMGMEMIFDSLVRRAGIAPGEVRLVARMDTELKGMEIVPEVSQRSTQAVVIAHFADRVPRRPRKDVNLRSDFSADQVLESIQQEQPPEQERR